jgi:hypothetical protein
MDSANVAGRVKALAKDRCADGLAGTMRERTAPGGDRGQGSGLAFTPTLVSSSSHPNEEGILATVSDGLHNGHSEVIEVDSFNFHDAAKLIRKQGSFKPILYSKELNILRNLIF